MNKREQRATIVPWPASGLPEQFITTAEAATRLRVSRSTIYEAIRTGQIPAWRFGNRWLLSDAGIEQALRGNRLASAARVESD
jgi:excisionase family DNA binding protein